VFRSSFANGLQGDGAYRMGESHTLRGGFYFSVERAEIDNHAAVFPADVSGNQTSSVPVTVVDNTAVTAWIYGVYLQDEWHPTAPLTISFGLRYDLIDAFAHADQFSPRIGAAYEFPTQTTLHVGYSRYFTPPPTELVSVVAAHKFDRTTGASPSEGSFAVRPERSHYFDAGLSQRIGSGFTVGVDGYFKYSDHILDEGQFGNAVVFSPFNYRRGRVYGTEATGSYSRGNLSTYINFAYAVAQGTQIETGQFNFGPEELAFINHHYIFLDHDQTFTSSGGASYTWHGYEMKADYLYGSGLRSGFANTGNLPFYIQANAGISHRFVVPHLGWLEARVDCLNLFDRTYLIRDGTGIGVQAAQYGPRRTLFAGIRVPLPFSQPAPAGS
jgi:outer membrane receptor for ferrienterochelin and colicin